MKIVIETINKKFPIEVVSLEDLYTVINRRRENQGYLFNGLWIPMEAQVQGIHFEPQTIEKEEPEKNVKKKK